MQILQPYLRHCSHVYQYAWNPGKVDFFTLIGNIIITVQYIKDVWMFNIHNMKKSKQESESENIVKCVYLDILIYVYSKQVQLPLLWLRR